MGALFSNNQSFIFNYKLNFKGCISRMVISYAVLNKKTLSSSDIQMFLILVNVFLLLKYKYCNTTKHFFLHIFILRSFLVVLHLRSHSNFLLSLQLLRGDVEMNPRPKLISKESFSVCHWNLYSITAHTKILY